ncbi:MAG: T9SS type A sorting domain-containing protein [Winogradskyella sp.]|uniref:T9SS type A sorting domain-containing protein n=1 Tax=Winogradskyella sp. TaxID=1883156 RepID=UPI00385E8018
MKKIYMFYVLTVLFSLGFSQTIVTIDRANIAGPTLTDNVANISSAGLTRGSGVAQSTVSGNFTSNGWTVAGNQATAETNNDYIEWSTTASTTFEITLTDLDIRLRRNTNGPTDWQIFYSLDNFATAGVALTGSQTFTAADTNEIFNLSAAGPGVLSGASGTITFRLYAWGATTSGGFLRVIQSNTWSISAAVPSPGIRLLGSVATTSTNSIESDITALTVPSVPDANIDYTAFNATSGLSVFPSANSKAIGAFTIRDGGAGSDTDTDNTILNSIEFTIANSENIAAIAIFDGFTNVAEVTTVTPLTNFTGLNLTAIDGGTKDFFVFATFKTAVTDNEQIQLTVHAVTTPATGSSLFATANAGGAETSIAGDDNRIEVTASQFEFVQQPTDGNQSEVMVPFPTIRAIDANLNLDLDANFTGIDVATISGSSSIVGETYNMVNGEATLDKIVFVGQEINRNLLASTTLPSISGTSGSFNIDGPLIAVAEQNFDTATGWTYTSDTPFFGTVVDWGDTVGYFGEIALTDASPINNTTFSDEILGENDLNDTANPFAVITLADIDVSSFSDVRIEFDWQVVGYNNNANDIQYRLRLNGGATGGWVTVFDGNGTINDDQGRVKINIPDGSSTAGLQVRLRNNRAAGYSGFDNFKIVSVFDGLVYSEAGPVSGWSPNAPSNTTGTDDAYILDGTYNVGSNIEIANFFINDGGTTTVTPGQSITANTGVINNGVLELNSLSTSYSSLITDNVTGEVIYNRHVNQFTGTGSSTGNNDLISAPVTNANQTFLALRTANSDIPSGNIGGVPSFLFGPFNNVTNSYVNYSATDDPSLIAAGIGYRTASTQPTGSTFRFVGDVETGTLSVPITVGAGSRSNLIGNPYPSYINLSTFLAENSTEFDPASSGVYGYIGDITSGFLVWNQAYADANPTAKLTPGQGFFVNSKTGGGSIDFTPAMRTTGTTDDFISGRAANQNLAHVNLKVTDNEQQYQTALYFNDNASLSMDPGYDSELFEATEPTFAIYSHLVEDNLGNNLAAQAVSFADLDNVSIPLGINVAQGVQAVVSIAEHNIPEGVSVTLEDNVTNTFTNLLDGDYTFTPNTTLTSTGRFYIHFSRSALSLNDDVLNGIEIYTDTQLKAIVVKGRLAAKTQCNLYDIQGRVISSQQLDANSTEHRIDASNLTSGIYVIELQSQNGTTKTEKLILR